MSKKNKGTKKEDSEEDLSTHEISTGAFEWDTISKTFGLPILAILIFFIAAITMWKYLDKGLLSDTSLTQPPTVEEIVEDVNDFKALVGEVELVDEELIEMSSMVETLESAVKALEKTEVCPEGKLTLSLPDGTFVGCLN